MLHSTIFSSRGDAFGFGAMPMIEEAANLLRGSGSQIVIVVDRRSDLTNEALDQALVRRRAKALRSELIRRGITAGRLVIGCTASVSETGTQPLYEELWSCT